MNVADHRTRARAFPTGIEITYLNVPGGQEGGIIEPTAVVHNSTPEEATYTITWYIDGEVGAVEEVDGLYPHPPDSEVEYTTEIGPLTEGDTEVCVTVDSVEYNSIPSSASDERCQDAGAGTLAGIPIYLIALLLLAVAVVLYKTTQ